VPIQRSHDIINGKEQLVCHNCFFLAGDILLQSQGCLEARGYETRLLLQQSRSRSDKYLHFEKNLIVSTSAHLFLVLVLLSLLVDKRGSGADLDLGRAMWLRGVGGVWFSRSRCLALSWDNLIDELGSAMLLHGVGGVWLGRSSCLVLNWDNWVGKLQSDFGWLASLGYSRVSSLNLHKNRSNGTYMSAERLPSSSSPSLRTPSWRTT
jgi:hypothetical protein